MWDTSKDTQTFQTRSQLDSSTQITKRICLSLTASVFEAPGIILPVTIRGKMLLQNMWRGKIDWDQEVPQEMADQWLKIVAGFRISTN